MLIRTIADELDPGAGDADLTAVLVKDRIPHPYLWWGWRLPVVVKWLLARGLTKTTLLPVRRR
jgi:hypothetical protein